MPHAIRKMSLLLLLNASILACATTASPQQQSAAPSSAEDPATKSKTQPISQQSAPQPSPAQNNFVPDNGQAPSLGDLARLARAKKKDEPKASKVIDDENMPRGGIYIGGSAPDSTGTARPGQKLMLLDFWASWCGPCRESLPDLKQLQASFGDQLQVISISEDENENAWKDFVAQNQMSWEQRFDSGGESARRYNAYALPTYILTDANGTVIRRYEGEDPQRSLVERIGPDIRKAQDPAAATANEPQNLRE
jgi:thiol-disulfide isomerase/thioredoxin